jgi:DNA-directed RNA polymerase beta' subunit
MAKQFNLGQQKQQNINKQLFFKLNYGKATKSVKADPKIKRTFSLMLGSSFNKQKTISKKKNKLLAPKINADSKMSQAKRNILFLVLELKQQKIQTLLVLLFKDKSKCCTDPTFSERFLGPSYFGGSTATMLKDLTFLPQNTSNILTKWLFYLLTSKNSTKKTGRAAQANFVSVARTGQKANLNSYEIAKETKAENLLVKNKNSQVRRRVSKFDTYYGCEHDNAYTVGPLKTGAVLLYKLLHQLALNNRHKINRFELVGFPKLKKLINTINKPMYEKLKNKQQISKTTRYIYNSRFKKYKKKVNRYLFIKSTLYDLEDLENKLPGNIILSLIPVIPPDLRPIVQLADGTEVSSDLNELYKKVLIRNQRYQKIGGANALFAQRLLQEAVDNLIDNGKVGDGFKSEHGRLYKSFSEILKGKKGRFRQNLLGKRVDYSGRSVIVVGPKLKLHECGLPVEMAVELFQPFLVRTIILATGISSVVGAKKLIKSGTPIIFDLLQKLMNDHPIILNRAPTLHRLGIQAFQSKLVSGRAIILHPLVCTAFNADFDGDQMGVHIPLSVEARTEAWSLLWARNNVLSPATGQPVLVPSQDMVLGCFYLTTHNPIKKYFRRRRGLFREVKQVCQSFFKNEIHNHTPIWVCYGYTTTMQNTTLIEIPVEIRICFNGHSLEIHKEKQIFFSFTGEKTMQVFRTTPGRIFFNRAIFLD